MTKTLWFSFSPGSGEDEVQTVSPNSQSVNLQADSWSDIGSSQVCCVDVQTPNAATITPVHNSNNNSNTHDLETACVFISSGDSGNNGSNGGSSVSGGGGGLNTLSTKLNPAGSIRSRSLSPVQDSSTQTSTVAFNGDVNVLTNNHTKEIYAAQGARPKVRKSSQPKRPSSVRTLPSPTNNAYANGSISTAMTTTTTSSATTRSSSTSSSSSSCSSVIPAVPADPAAVPTALTCSPVSPEPEVAGMLKRISSGGGEGGPRWADPASHTIKYIDEEVSDSSELPFENNLVADCSSAAPSSAGLAPSSVILERRLYLAQNKMDGEESVSSPSEDSSPPGEGKPPKGVQLQSVGVGSDSVTVSPVEETRKKCVFDSLPAIPTTRELNAPTSNLLSNGIGGSDIEILHSASLPSSPIHGASKSETPTRKTREEVLKGKCRHLSPVFRRKGKHGAGDSLEEDLVLTVMEDFKGGQTYHNLETFQKAQLKHKVCSPTA